MNSAISTEQQSASQSPGPNRVDGAEMVAADSAPLSAMRAYMQHREQLPLAQLLLSSYAAFGFFLAQALLMCAPLVALIPVPALERLLLDLQRQLSKRQWENRP